MTLSNEQWLKIYGVQQEPKTFSAIPQERQFPALCMAAVVGDGENLQYVVNKDTRDLRGSA